MDAKHRTGHDLVSQQMMYQQMLEAKKEGIRSLEETQHKARTPPVSGNST